MTATELRDLLNSIIEQTAGRDLEVAIPVFNPNAIGPRARVGVEAVDLGFDWDMGKLFLRPAIKPGESLRVITAEERKQIMKQSREALEQQLKDRPLL
ncbi:hypothetical protein CL689_03520 [Candidatus Saccharibacteria bacterium]|nr:hypothetical protein [Candidatus Saccharibacteria bacterium]|tara:strand:- start:5919 stop:6212 length:294 start_codon:yes stop_codon:yes gene_type:complete